MLLPFSLTRALSSQTVPKHLTQMSNGAKGGALLAERLARQLNTEETRILETRRCLIKVMTIFIPVYTEQCCDELKGSVSEGRGTYSVNLATHWTNRTKRWRMWWCKRILVQNVKWQCDCRPLGEGGGGSGGEAVVLEHGTRRALYEYTLTRLFFLIAHSKSVSWTTSTRLGVFTIRVFSSVSPVASVLNWKHNIWIRLGCWTTSFYLFINFFLPIHSFRASSSTLAIWTATFLLLLCVNALSQLPSSGTGALTVDRNCTEVIRRALIKQYQRDQRIANQICVSFPALMFYCTQSRDSWSAGQFFWPASLFPVLPPLLPPLTTPLFRALCLLHTRGNPEWKTWPRSDFSCEYCCLLCLIHAWCSQRAEWPLVML